MILMISPGKFWLSAQQDPPRRKLCPEKLPSPWVRRKLCPEKLPSPWVTAFSFLSNTAPVTWGRLAHLGTDRRQRGVLGRPLTWGTGVRVEGWQCDPDFSFPALDGLGPQDTDCQRTVGIGTKESRVKYLSASNFCFANRLALRNRPKNVTRHAAPKTK